MTFFYDELEQAVTKTTTHNGAPTFSSSLNKNLDFFALKGAVRGWKEEDIQKLFVEAYQEDKETALRNLVHLRDIRGGGLGERQATRVILKLIVNELPTHISYRLASRLGSLGRWDDVVYLLDVTEDKNLKFGISGVIAKQLSKDLKNKEENKGVSLLAKWLPSPKTSNKDKRRLARKLIKHMYGQYSPKMESKYRKDIVSLRDYLNVTEVRMSAKEYDKIDYEKVPSKAMINYRNAFKRNDKERFEAYIDSVIKGEKKMNASVTYPYEIVHRLRCMRGYSDPTLEQAWKSLPDYLEGVDERAIIVADTSGSMGCPMYNSTTAPIDVAVSLAIYCAERLKGEFKGKFITFSSTPTLQTINSEFSLHRNIRDIMSAPWGGSTDLLSVFRLVLNTAVQAEMKQDQLPDKIVVVSDMQFNYGVSMYGNRLDETTHAIVKREFEDKGYKLPEIIYWNVNASSKIMPVRKDEIGTALVSGLTPSIFSNVLNGSISNPEKLMKDVLYTDRYDFVKEILQK